MKTHLPSVLEHNPIVAEVEAHNTTIDCHKAKRDRQFSRSHRIRQSTLAAVLAGDL